VFNSSLIISFPTWLSHLQPMTARKNEALYCDMMPESRKSLLLGNCSVNTIPRKRNARNNRKAVFSVLSAGLVATQRCGKHVSAAMNEHATIEEAMFCVQSAPMLYNEALTQIEVELRVSPELAVGRIIEKKWQERNYAVLQLR
jgi:hypothetical protein